MKRERGVSSYIPEEKHVAMADRRTDGFIEAWAASIDKDLRTLVRSAYLQGLSDMAETVVRMKDNPVIVEMPEQGLEGL